MSRKFGKKISPIGLPEACHLMSTASAARAVVVLGNNAPVAGWKNINAKFAINAQSVNLGDTIDVATVDVLLRTTTSSESIGNIPVDLIIHDVAVGALIATTTAYIPCCYTGNVSFTFPLVGPWMLGGTQYDLQINSSADPDVTTLEWAYTAYTQDPQIGLSIWDYGLNPANNFRFRIHS